MKTRIFQSTRTTFAGAFRRIMAAALAAAALLTTALADDSFDSGAFVRELADAEIGDTVFFGAYEQDNDESNGKEPIEWIVLDRQDNRVLLISRQSLDYRPMDSYDNSYMVPFNYNVIYHDDWARCDMRQWLNGEFLTEAFSPSEQRLLAETIVRGAVTIYGNRAGSDALDKVFLLSVDEAETYFSTREELIPEPTEYAKAAGRRREAESKGREEFDEYDKYDYRWWLGQYDPYGYYFYVYYASDPSDPFIGWDMSQEYKMVRPAVWVGLTRRSRTVSDTSDMYIEPFPHSNLPCAEDLEQIDGNAVLPKEASYLLYYEGWHVWLEQDDGAYVYNKPAASQTARGGTFLENYTNVYVAARENGYSYIVYAQESDGEEIYHSAWIKTEELGPTHY